MKAWGVILAALVIFAAGVVTGGLTVRLKVREASPVTSTSDLGPIRPRGDLLERMQRQLYLTPPQRVRIEQILRENHERMKQLWDSIAPRAQEEHRRVNELIRGELNLEQQRRFDELIKTRGSNRIYDERRRREDRREHRPFRKEAPGGAAPGTNDPEGRVR